MDKQGIPTNSYHVALPLTVCTATREVGVRQQLHKHILHNHQASNSVVHNFVVATLVEMYTKCWFLDEAISMFTNTWHHEQDQEGKRRLKVSVSTWTAMVMALGQQQGTGPVQGELTLPLSLSITLSLPSVDTMVTHCSPPTCRPASWTPWAGLAVLTMQSSSSPHPTARQGDMEDPSGHLHSNMACADFAVEDKQHPQIRDIYAGLTMLLR